MAEPYFIRDGERIIATAHGAGPWDPSMLHGAAPAGLVASIAEGLPSKVPMRTVRLTIDIKRPVPIAPLDVDLQITREGRNIITADIRLTAHGKEVVQASILKIREAAQDLPDGMTPPVLDFHGPEHGAIAEGFAGVPGYNQGVEFRVAVPLHQGVTRRGCWFRVKRPYFSDHPTTALVRAASAADYCNAVGMELDFYAWSYINADLSIHFARPPVGEWMLLAAESWVGPDGRGLAFGALADQEGYFGRSIQSLVIAPR